MVKPSMSNPDLTSQRLEAAKCPQSPTKVHHWIIPMLGAQPIGRCRYCGEERMFNNTGSRWDYGEKNKIADRMGTVKTSTYDRYYAW
ncbi:hypothetical protein LCGC14_1128650 [marine sediment metagenome]|uniref:Uncharacterized protein n=1 Tax=marine sediment metagenome TaxID=412755 RepID=A0A0F9M6I8_9ZZZZ